MSPSAIRHILLSIMLVGGAVLAGYLPDHSIFRCALFSALPVLGMGDGVEHHEVAKDVKPRPRTEKAAVQRVQPIQRPVRNDQRRGFL